jgi:hypothetical protein
MLPAYGLVMAAPLVDVAPINGPTEFLVGSHFSSTALGLGVRTRYTRPCHRAASFTESALIRASVSGIVH